MLLEALGYAGRARYVGLWWLVTRDGTAGVRWDDGDWAALGHTPAWRALLDHPAGDRLLGHYQLGQGSHGEHWLLADRATSTLSVGRCDDVEKLVNEQPSAVETKVKGLPDGAARGTVDEAIAEFYPRTFGPAAHLRRKRLTADLGRWLDGFSGA
jgi:hypothetical protein